MTASPPSRIRLSRRAVLLGAAVGAVLFDPMHARATPEAALAKLRGWTKANESKPGRVRLVLPDVADNGAQVPMEVIVDSPMTDVDHVKALHVVADDNPNPEVVSVYFTPESGRAQIQTRIRLARSQRVTAWAEMSDGSVWGTRVNVTVTIGGCGAG